MKQVPQLIEEQIIDIEARIGHRFRDRELLTLAFTHKSCVNDYADNQRLEFLGDSVLGFLIASYIYDRHPDFDEGRMTRIRAQVIRESTLFEAVTEMGIARHLRMNKGELLTKGRERPSNLADLFEALVAAIYLDAGMDAARKFVERHLMSYLQCSIEGGYITDFKSTLQELIQQSPGMRLQYQLVAESGKDHDKSFCTSVLIDGVVRGEGVGKTKKQSEQEAARKALEHIRSRHGSQAD